MQNLPRGRHFGMEDLMSTSWKNEIQNVCKCCTQDHVLQIQCLCKALKICDYAELRLDFLKGEKMQNPKDTLVWKSRVIKEKTPQLSRTVCTLRPKSEGGVFEGTEKERLSIMKLIAEYNPFLLDIEYSTMRKNPTFLRYISKTKTDVLCSWHDFKKTPSLSELIAQRCNHSKYEKTPSKMWHLLKL